MFVVNKNVILATGYAPMERQIRQRDSVEQQLEIVRFRSNDRFTSI